MSGSVFLPGNRRNRAGVFSAIYSDVLTLISAVVDNAVLLLLRRGAAGAPSGGRGALHGGGDQTAARAPGRGAGVKVSAPRLPPATAGQAHTARHRRHQTRRPAAGQKGEGHTHAKHVLTQTHHHTQNT